MQRHKAFLLLKCAYFHPVCEKVLLSLVVLVVDDSTEDFDLKATFGITQIVLDYFLV